MNSHATAEMLNAPRLMLEAAAVLQAAGYRPDLQKELQAEAEQSRSVWHRCNDLRAALQKILDIKGSTGGSAAMVREFKTIADLALARAADGKAETVGA